MTVEAYAAAKAVITCHDSGGPLEFVRDRENGLIVAPDPAAVARACIELSPMPPWPNGSARKARGHRPPHLGEYGAQAGDVSFKESHEVHEGHEDARRLSMKIFI